MLLPQAHLHAHAAGPGPSENMIISAETTSAGESFALRCNNFGVYNANIDWGDGQQSTITAYNDPDLTHVYASAGIHTIEISGDLPNIDFAGTGDALKMRGLSNWGMVTERLFRTFQGCSNMELTAMDAPMPTDGNAQAAFKTGPKMLVTSSWTLSNITNMYEFLSSNYNTPHSIDAVNWNLNALVSAVYAFNVLQNVNLNVSGWGLANLQAGDYMFRFCTGLDRDMSAWDLSSIQSTAGMFQRCDAMSTPSVDSLLQSIYTQRMNFTWATPSMDISDMASPSGDYQYANPPTTGKEYIYWLENDPDTEGFNTWSFTY